MTDQYLHGVRVIQAAAGPRAIRTVATGIIGLVGTAPDSQAQASAALATGVLADDNALTWSAVTPGADANAIAVHLKDPLAVSQALAVSVAAGIVTVSLATDGSGVVTSTADLVKAAIVASAAASALVTVADTGASDGTGVVAASVKPQLLTGGLDDAFPLNTPVAVYGSRAQAALLGATGTLPLALGAILEQTGAMVVVVRVAEGIDAAATLTNVIGATGSNNTGVWALLDAEPNLGLRPRVLGVPGLDSPEVTAAMIGVADRLRGFVYASCWEATTVAAAIAYRAGFGSRRLMLIWPDFTGWDPTTSAIATLTAVSRALGMRAKIDNEQGWHKTLSNVDVAGVTGISRSVGWSLQDVNSEANTLNANEVTTLIRASGLRFWGSRTCSIDPLYAFESAVRTDDVLADTIAEAHLWAIDKPMTRALIADILEGIRAKGRTLKAQGYLIDMEVWIDPEKNTITELTAGKLAVDYKFTPVPPLENLNLYQTLTNEYLSQLVL